MIPAFLAGFIFACAIGFFLMRSAYEQVSKMRLKLEASAEESEIVLRFMHEIVTDVGEGADKGRIYERILRTLTLACGASCACVYEKNTAGRLVAVANIGMFPPQREIPPVVLRSISSRAEMFDKILKGEELEPHEGVIGEVFVSKKALLIKNATASARVVNHKDPALKITSIMAIPMIFRDEFYGVVAVANPIGGEYFGDSDFSIACSIADQSALSLYNISAFNQIVEKNKLDFDLGLASSVQSYLLSECLKDSNGCEFAAKYIPQQKVGGDFYDTFDLGGGKMAAVIGDVSGKGVSAAILMAICMTNLRYLAAAESSPCEVLKALNKKMIDVLRSDMFVTIVYAVIDVKNNCARLARAGHEKPILYSKRGGSATFINSKGPAVAMMRPEIFDSLIGDVEVPFEPGDTLLLYTDGVTESCNSSGEEFSNKRLINILNANSQLGAAELNERILSSVNEFTGEQKPTKDDFTILTIKRKQ